MALKLNGRILQIWREAADMSLDRASVYASDLMSRDISSEYIRRMEKGSKDVEDWDPVVVLALAQIYGVKVRDLPPALAERVERIRRILDLVPRERAKASR